MCIIQYPEQKKNFILKVVYFNVQKQTIRYQFRERERATPCCQKSLQHDDSDGRYTELKIQDNLPAYSALSTPLLCCPQAEMQHCIKVLVAKTRPALQRYQASILSPNYYKLPLIVGDTFQCPDFQLDTQQDPRLQGDIL